MILAEGYWHGTIIFRSEIVKGLTTAATIWAVSAAPMKSSAIMAACIELTSHEFGTE